MARIAVVGGGIFGVTAAIKLAQQGYHVELFERNRELLMGASGINQFRLHRGYHYPRSQDTALSCRESEDSFLNEYGDAVVDGVDHYYGIAKQGSRVSADQYLAFCERHGLDYEMAWPDVVRRESLEVCVKVRERLIDPDLWRAICQDRLTRLSIPVHLNTDATESLLDPYDIVIVATYAAINTMLSRAPAAQAEYQFELCEKPVLRLPTRFQGQSVVIMDGPFMCLDPFGRRGLFLMGHVVHAIHQQMIGTVPHVDARFRPLLNAGVITHPSLTHVPRFLRAAVEFFPGIEQAEHVGSMFTIRTVLPYKDATDERPTIVKQIGDRVITVFSGKIGTCVEAAAEIVRLVTGRAPAHRHPNAAPVAAQA